MPRSRCLYPAENRTGMMKMRFHHHSTMYMRSHWEGLMRCLSRRSLAATRSNGISALTLPWLLGDDGHGTCRAGHYGMKQFPRDHASFCRSLILTVLFFLISSFCFTRSLSRLFFRSKDFLNFSISRWQSFSFAAYVQDALYTARRMPARTTGWPATALKRWIYVYIYIRVDGKTNWTDYIKVEKGRGRQSSKKLGGLRGDEEGCWTLTAIWWRQVIRLLLLFTPPVFLP